MSTNGTASMIESCNLCGAARAVQGFILAPSGPIPCRSGAHPPTTISLGVARDNQTASAIGDDIYRQVKEGDRVYDPAVIYGTAAKSGIVTERRRSIEVIDRMACQVSEALIVAFALERQARVAERHGEADQAAGVARMHETTLKTLEAARKELLKDPALCSACGGSKQVPSRLAAGQLVPCTACAPAAAEVIPPG